jgi:hypothetical protein
VSSPSFRLPLPRPAPARHRARVVAAVGLLVLLLAARARAAGSHVILLRTMDADPLGRQAETLLAAELRAAGFEVEERPRSPALDPRADIERGSAGRNAIATLALVALPGTTAAEIWLMDRVTGKLVVRRIDTAPGSGANDPSDIALRAVELLRGSLLEIAIERRRPARAETPPSPPPPDVSRFVAETAPWRPVHFLHGLGVGLGAVALGVGAGSGPSYAPAVRLSWGSQSGVGVRLSVVGLGSAVTFESRDGMVPLGTATVHRDLAVLDGFLVARHAATWQPFVSAGTGVARLRVEGKGASALFPDRTGTRLGGIACAGAGVAARLGQRAALVLEAQLLVLLPRTRVLIADQTAVTLGGATALLGLSLVTVF